MSEKREKNIFPKEFMERIEEMLKVDKSNMSDFLLSLGIKTHEIIDQIYKHKRLLNSLQEKKRVLEHTILLQLKTGTYKNIKVKYANQNEIKIALESDAEWLSIDSDIDLIESRINFLMDIKDTLKQTQFAVQNVMEWERWTKGES